MFTNRVFVLRGSYFCEKYSIIYSRGYAERGYAERGYSERILNAIRKQANKAQ